jgi:stage II sporulation protein P
VVNTQVENFLPLYGVARRELWSEQRQRQYREEQLGIITYENELSEEGLSNAADGTNKIEESNAETDMQTLLQAENNAAREVAEFVPHEQQSQVNLEELQNYETLVKNFYTIDSNTMAGSDQLQVDSLLKLDMSIKKEGEGPQILIYHTHSQETFADSVEGDAATTIEGVGEHLSQILQEKYGYRVLHHTGRYDVETRNNAYGNALPELEKLLEENPSIQVVIDLHRDEVASDTKLVIDLDGRPTARFMFFNGLSRTKQSGDITYLQNDNIAGNLAFSFQMQLKCEEYYPGLTRKIYLKGYRYNMHLKPRSLLVELGAQNNTVEEAMNACEPLAHVLDMVLSGE